MVTSDLLVGQTPAEVVWRSVTTMHGALCVMISGITLMPTWSVDNLGSFGQVLSFLIVKHFLFLIT